MAAGLGISKEKAIQMEKIEATSYKLLQDYLDGKRSGGDDVVVARTIIGVVKSNRQTDTNRKVLAYSMVRELEDPAMRKRYVAASMPEIKQLESGKKGYSMEANQIEAK